MSDFARCVWTVPLQSGQILGKKSHEVLQPLAVAVVTRKEECREAENWQSSGSIGLLGKIYSDLATRRAVGSPERADGTLVRRMYETEVMKHSCEEDTLGDSAVVRPVKPIASSTRPHATLSCWRRNHVVCGLNVP